MFQKIKKNIWSKHEPQLWRETQNHWDAAVKNGGKFDKPSAIPQAPDLRAAHANTFQSHLGPSAHFVHLNTGPVHQVDILEFVGNFGEFESNHLNDAGHLNPLKSYWTCFWNENTSTPFTHIFCSTKLRCKPLRSCSCIMKLKSLQLW